MSKYKQAPTIWTLEELKTYRCQTEKGRARPLGLETIPNRLKAAWLVFKGKADAVIWPEGQ